MTEFRVLETSWGAFIPQVKIVYYGLFKKTEKWVSLSRYGQPCMSSGYVPAPPSKECSTLEEAKEFIVKLKHGNKIHEV